MFRFLSAEALYGLLLVTTFASVGLLGLWAATSRWHPFLRITIVLAILSVLLLRPMFEPFVMLVSQVATIAVCVALHRRFLRFLERRKANRENSGEVPQKLRYQFSLKTLFIALTIVAIGFGVWPIISQVHADTMNLILAGFRVRAGTFLAAMYCPWPKDRYGWFFLPMTSILNVIPMVVASYECFFWTEVNPLEVFGYSTNSMLLAAICYAVLLTIVLFVCISLWMKQAHINQVGPSQESVEIVSKSPEVV